MSGTETHGDGMGPVDVATLAPLEEHCAWRSDELADGYRTTIVKGEVTYQDGEPTEALPGRLLRGGRPAPR